MNRETIINNNLLGRKDFLKEIEQNFPASFREMHDLDDELLHIDMANFARTTESAITGNDSNLAKKHFEFIGKLFTKANPDLENAIYVSYLENLLLGQKSKKYTDARRLLPENLEKALFELEEHFEKLYEP